MYQQNNLLDALDTVLSWDLPDSLIPMAISDQSRLIAGFQYEETWDRYPD